LTPHYFRSCRSGLHVIDHNYCGGRGHIFDSQVDDQIAGAGFVAAKENSLPLIAKARR
jgi:hypothetical protein